MNLSSWPNDELTKRLKGPGVNLQTGPFINRIRTRLPSVIEGMALLYADYPVIEALDFADFHVELRQPLGPRRWFRPQVLFEFDGESLFKPLPVAQALPMVEWGLNWCIGNHAHQFLIVHAAAIERGGLAAILPGSPGAGKSTLTAFLVNHGWRLLSDELALLSLTDGSVTALARPISLKNESIGIIEELIPDARLSCRSKDTAKGTVALLKPPLVSVRRAAETARPGWVIFPRFKKGAEASLVPRSKADSLIEVGRNAFNYSIHGSLGFKVLSRLMDTCACYDFTYSDLAAALRVFEELKPEPGLSHGIPA